jgi:hypothetical protein
MTETTWCVKFFDDLSAAQDPESNTGPMNYRRMCESPRTWILSVNDHGELLCAQLMHPNQQSGAEG